MLKCFEPFFHFPKASLEHAYNRQAMLLPPNHVMLKKVQNSYLTRYIVTLQNLIEPELVLRSKLALERKSWGQFRPRH